MTFHATSCLVALDAFRRERGRRFWSRFWRASVFGAFCEWLERDDPLR